MNSIQEQIKVFKALSDKTRLDMIKRIAGKKEFSCKEISAIYPNLSQPTLSHHFTKLVDAGVLTTRKEGTGNFYSVNSPFLIKMGIRIAK